MGMLTESVDAVIGVDTHRDTLAAAALSTLGAVLADTQVDADARGYAALLDFAALHAPGRRCWAVEGAGSYGAGLAIFLAAHGERVVEVARPKRPARAGARKSDQIDAVRAAREALSTEHLIAPRGRGHREALRVLMSTRASAVTARTGAINHLKALIVSAPETLRVEFRGKTSDAQISYASKLRPRPTQDIEHRMTLRALRCTAERIVALRAEADELEREISQLVTATYLHRSGRTARAGAGGTVDTPVNVAIDDRGRGQTPTARPARCRRDQRCPSPHQLVTPRPVPLRSGLRGLLRRRTDPGLVRLDYTPPPQQIRRPAAQPSTPYDRVDPHPDRSRDP